MNDTLKIEAMTYKYWILRDRQICDIEMIMNGAFAPLNGFLGTLEFNPIGKYCSVKANEISLSNP